MKLAKLCSLFAACLSLAACDQTVNVQNGHIPAQYLAAAQQIVGTYNGNVDNNSNALTISMNGDQAVLTSTNDIAGNTCQSKIGALRSFSFNADNNVTKITNVEFAFDANYCAYSVMGDHVDLDFTGVNAFQLSLFDRTETFNQCDYGPPPPYYGELTHPVGPPPPPYYPGNQCHIVYIQHYTTGYFAR